MVPPTFRVFVAPPNIVITPIFVMLLLLLLLSSLSFVEIECVLGGGGDIPPHLQIPATGVIRGSLLLQKLLGTKEVLA
jgi:hypothetical protein